MQGPDDGRIQPTKAFTKRREENEAHREEVDGRTRTHGTAADLSRADLLRLLGVMEGEVQVGTRGFHTPGRVMSDADSLCLLRPERTSSAC